MEVQDLLRAISEAVERTLEDFYNQTGFLIQSVNVDVEYQMVFGAKAPAHANVTVRCGVDLETETQKNLEARDFLRGGKDFVE